jgi:hypothetical protein
MQNMERKILLDAGSLEKNTLNLWNCKALKINNNKKNL